jgi:hypothetical protein
MKLLPSNIQCSWHWPLVWDDSVNDLLETGVRIVLHDRVHILLSRLLGVRSHIFTQGICIGIPIFIESI